MTYNPNPIGRPNEREIQTAKDADSIRADIESVFDGWFSEGPIDWEDFLDRLEKGTNYDLGEKLDSPAIRRIKAIVRELRRQSE